MDLRVESLLCCCERCQPGGYPALYSVTEAAQRQSDIGVQMFGFLVHPSCITVLILVGLSLSQFLHLLGGANDTDLPGLYK